MRKFRNIPTEVDGLKFASKREAKRYGELKLLERLGQIQGLCADKSQLRYPLKVNGTEICKYEADFRYREKEQTILEDAKGFKTPVYRLKRKLMRAIYGIEIQEV